MPPANRIRPVGPCRAPPRRPPHRTPRPAASPRTRPPSPRRRGSRRRRRPTSTARPAPKVKRFACRTDCVSVGSARPGSLVRVYGKGLKDLGEVLFFGADGDEADDAAVAPAQGRPALGARPRAARRRDRPRSACAASTARAPPASKRPLTIAPADVELPAGVVDAEVQEQKVFFGSRKPASLSYVVGGSRPRASTSQLLRGSDGAVVTSWSEQAVEPGATQTVEWDGTVGGKVASQGLYRFQVTATDAAGDPRDVVAGPRAGRGRGAGRVPLPQVPLPDPGRARLRRDGGGVRRRPRPSGPGRLRRVRHAARRRARRARSSSSSTSRARATTSSSTAPARASTTPTCTCASPRWSTRATRSRRAS